MDLGELPEWSIGADSKSVVPFGVPGVRIPHSPPEKTDTKKGGPYGPPCQNPLDINP